MGSRARNAFIKRNAIFWKRTYVLLFLLLICIVMSKSGYAELEAENSSESMAVASDFELKKAVMCERLKGSDPINQTVVFSVSKERAFCFSVFDPVFKEDTISHNWYYRDKIISRYKRTIKPPRWETYSSHRIGTRTKGPWRVEITDSAGNVISVLRFSVSD